jgi:hypothetical protein
VVESPAINPDTVLTAYRELEREGLAEGRPGMGTFVRQGLAGLGIPLERKVGGQRAQVAVTLSLASRPDLLVLDEPLPNLDPLARHDVMHSIMVEVAGRELTVLLSSRVVSDLEETCDWLVVLNGAFWGAPLLGREYECGTHRLAWTQSVPMWRWPAAWWLYAFALGTAAGILFRRTLPRWRWSWPGWR